MPPCKLLRNMAAVFASISKFAHSDRCSRNERIRSAGGTFCTEKKFLIFNFLKKKKKSSLNVIAAITPEFHTMPSRSQIPIHSFIHSFINAFIH